MKAILEFDLTDQDDKLAHLRAIKAIDMALSLHEIDNKLRSIEKHSVDTVFTRENLHEILSDNNIILDELLN